MKPPYTKTKSEWKHHLHYVIQPFGLRKTGLVDTEVLIKKELRETYIGWPYFKLSLKREVYYAIYCNLKFKSGQTFCGYALVPEDSDLEYTVTLLYSGILKTTGLQK